MARVIRKRNSRPYVIVFWEGESEEEYFKFLKNEFHEKASIKIHNKKGIFDTAGKAFRTKGVYADDRPYVDEIWFVFDTEVELRGKWDTYWKVVSELRRRCEYAKVRLFMTKGCIEYFFLLHYEKCAPMIETPTEKKSILTKLAASDRCPGYKKGDPITIKKIAERYMDGIKNGQWSLQRLEDEFASASDEDERTKILFLTDSTFTNAHEAVEYLVNLPKK